MARLLRHRLSKLLMPKLLSLESLQFRELLLVEAHIGGSSAVFFASSSSEIWLLGPRASHSHTDFSSCSQPSVARIVCSYSSIGFDLQVWYCLPSNCAIISAMHRFWNATSSHHDAQELIDTVHYATVPCDQPCDGFQCFLS